jgi:DNA-directed RNA polymerase specialized sigma24 family protein
MSADASPQRAAKGSWKLTEAAFERLLAALDHDRERGAVAYERLRHRLIGLLQWWGAPAAEDLADATLDRLARKLEEGAVIAAGSLGAYARGVARMIFYEAGRDARVPPPPEPDPKPEDAERALTCLDRCLEALPPDERRLVLRYYEDGHKAELRRRLAAEAELSATALRIRVHRLRERLEACVTACRESP